MFMCTVFQPGIGIFRPDTKEDTYFLCKRNTMNDFNDLDIKPHTSKILT